MEPIRTHELMTAGIVNVPLTKPATLFFNIKNTEKDFVQRYENILTVFTSFKINFEQRVMGNSVSIISREPILPELMKNIYHNFKSLRPRFQSDFRYFFWEIDTKDDDVLMQVLKVYFLYKLPVYVHESMRGYHFISVKPIHKDLWKRLVEDVRSSNAMYPPITLRIKPNKYINESATFCNGWIQSEVEHSDTTKLYQYMQAQRIDMLERNYFIVYYPIDKREVTC